MVRADRKILIIDWAALNVSHLDESSEEPSRIAVGAQGRREWKSRECKDWRDNRSDSRGQEANQLPYREFCVHHRHYSKVFISAAAGRTA
jgi:hypothetical protein